MISVFRQPTKDACSISRWAARSDVEGSEYELLIPLSGQLGTYTFSMMAYVSADFGGPDAYQQLCHSRWYDSEAASDSAAWRPTSNGGWPASTEAWQIGRYYLQDSMIHISEVPSSSLLSLLCPWQSRDCIPPKSART